MEKKVEVKSLKDLRSITKTDVFSKILEQFMLDRIYKQLIGKINVNQYGGIKGGSTALYLTKMMDFILKSLEIPGCTVIVTVLDMMKGFDLCDHSVLACALVDYGVDPYDILWICSFLKDRMQVVKIGNFQSEFRKLTCGVPAGTKLAPLLFIILINKILEGIQSKFGGPNSNSAQCGFVDDVTIIERVFNYKPITQEILNCISETAKDVKMRLNPKKCSFIVIDMGKDKSKSNEWEFSVEGVKIPRVNDVKILGLSINNKLKWDEQIYEMVTKVNKRLFILRKLHDTGFGLEEKIHAYVTFIRPLMEYCSPIWTTGLCNNLMRKIISCETVSYTH